MSTWQIVWNAYYSESTILKIFKNILVKTTKMDKLYLAFLSVGFFLFCLMFMKKTNFLISDTDDYIIWLILAGLVEVFFLIKLDSVNKKLLLNEYGSEHSKITTPVKDNHQSTRYLMFKKQLQENNLTKSHIEDCDELLEIQIDIASTSDTGLKNLSNFTFGILLGLLGALWKHAETKELIFITVVLIMFFIVIQMVSSAFPSKQVRLKELKYFLQLYKSQVS